MTHAVYCRAAAGYVQVAPLAEAGADLTLALLRAGVPADDLATAAICDWVAIAADGAVVPLAAATPEGRRSAALTLTASGPVTLCRGIARGRARLYERQEVLVALDAAVAAADPGLDLVGPAGYRVAKALNPRNARDLRVLAGQLAGQLRPVDQAMARAALEQALQRLDVNWPALSGAEGDRVWAAARQALDPHHGSLAEGIRAQMPTYVQRISVALEGLAEATRKALHATYLPRLGTTLEQRDVRAVQRVAAQQGWWVRDRLGQRSDLLTRQGREVVRRGLADGLGRDEIGQRLRAALPDMWDKQGANYARLNAGMAMARARSYSELTSYEDAGIEMFEIVAVIDEATTDICRSLDGQFISVGKARGHADAQMAIAQPEDIGQVAPLCRSVHRDGGQYIETANGDTIAQVLRSGYGNVDDRGANAYHRIGDQIADAGVGMPPYHMQCRTTTVPRMSMPVPVPGKIPVAAPEPPPLPQGASMSAGFVAERAIQMVDAPRPGRPSLGGSISLLDDAVLPTDFDGAGAAEHLWIGDGAFGTRTWAADGATLSFAPRTEGAVAPFGAATDDMARALANLNAAAKLLPEDGGSLLVDLYHRRAYATGGLPRLADDEIAHLMSVAAREDLGNRELLLRLQVPGDAVAQSYLRVQGSRVPAGVRHELQRQIAAYQAGDVAAEDLAAAVRAFRDLGVADGWLRTATATAAHPDVLGDVARDRYARVTSGAPEIESPRKLAGYKIPPPPAPKLISAAPEVAPVRVAAPRSAAVRAEQPVTPSLWNARPPADLTSRAEWYGRGGHWSAARAHPETGEAVGRREWEEVPERRIGTQVGPDLARLPLSDADRVVNVQMGQIQIPIDRDPRAIGDLWGDIVAGERRREFTGTRDYILRDGRGVTAFVRYDSRAWAGASDGDVAHLFDAMASGAPAKIGGELVDSAALIDRLARGGNLWANDVREFYEQPVVDYSVPGLIAGVPVHEQIDRRVAAVRAEIEGRVAARLAADGAASADQRAQAVAAELRAALRREAGEGDIARALHAPPEAASTRSRAQREAAAQRDVRHETDRKRAVLVPSTRTQYLLEDALVGASEQLRQEFQRRWAPRLIDAPNVARPYSVGSRRSGEAERPAAIVADLASLESAIPRAGSTVRGMLINLNRLSDAGRATYEAIQHEFQHWVDDMALHTSVARRVRNGAVQDGLLRERRTPNPDHPLDPAFDAVEVYLPGRFADSYDGRVYDLEIAALRGAGLLDGKRHAAADYLSALTRVPLDAAASTEFLSTAARRFSRAGTDRDLAQMWDINPDQAAAYVSVMRGHYVP